MSGEGTAAIDARVDGADGAPADERWMPHPPHRSSEAGPLAEVTGHRVRSGLGTVDPGHWHLVTYGLSEVDDKESADPDISGWGFELTLRLAGADTDPEWAVSLLTNLANYVWTTGHGFAPGHHLDLRGPMKLDSDSVITAAAIVADPTLGNLHGPFGSVEFLQVVGLTADELELCRAWSTEGVMDLLADSDPLLVTHLDRHSILEDPAVAERVAARAMTDGSSLTELRVASLRWRTRFGGRAVVELGAGASAALGPALRRELVAPGASFVVQADDQQVRFVVGDQPRWTPSGDRLDVELPLDEVDGLATLFDGRTGWGHRPALPRLRFRVVA
ncbi:MAG: suppressor of fused domain protein [Acidimicrobiales bacterium]